MVRTDHLGVTSIIRALSLCEKKYECLIKPAQITRFYNNLMQEGSNKATGGALDAVSVAAVNRTFSAVMGKAVKWGYINSNPVSRAEKPRVEQKESTYLDADEARHMLELIQEEPIHWRTVIIFDLFSGLRRQELLGLKWEDIDFDKRTITVRRTVNYVPKKGVYESTTKSKKSRRPLHISATAVGLLLEVQRWQQQREKELGDAWKGEGYVFTKDDGERQFPDSITAWFHKFVMRNNLPDVHVHSLRHTFASLQIADGVPLVAVSRQLGHAKPSTTSDIYAHVIAEVEAQADKTFDRFADVLNLDEDATNTKKPKKFKKNGTE
jgi:integrase